MTREEAIKELSYIIDEMPSMECADWIEAISMGIKALAQKPCDDAISRQAAIDAISELNAVSFYEAQKDSKECYYEIRNAIKQLPFVTPAEKVGHWIIYDVHGHKACKCSECDMDVSYPCNDKFCKYCGSKMQEVEE